jgi:GDP-L-fucose synthase
VPTVTVWGSGKPRREFLFSDDIADACIFLMNLPSTAYDTVHGNGQSVSGRVGSRLVNIGVGKDVTIGELAELVGSVVGFSGDIVFDASKPEGTPRKLMDIQKLTSLGWRASTGLREGLRAAYEAFTAPREAASWTR